MADVLALFDERARAYLPGAPTVLRFEGCDLAVFVMRGPHIALHVGSLETDAPVAGLRWKSLRPCSYAIGRQVSDLVFCTDENGVRRADSRGAGTAASYSYAATMSSR